MVEEKYLWKLKARFFHDAQHYENKLKTDIHKYISNSK